MELNLIWVFNYSTTLCRESGYICSQQFWSFVRGTSIPSNLGKSLICATGGVKDENVETLPPVAKQASRSFTSQSLQFPGRAFAEEAEARGEYLQYCAIWENCYLKLLILSRPTVQNETKTHHKALTNYDQTYPFNRIEGIRAFVYPLTSSPLYTVFFSPWMQV